VAVSVVLVNIVSCKTARIQSAERLKEGK